MTTLSKTALYCVAGIMIALLRPQAANAQSQASCPGTVLYSYKGVNVYSNGADENSGTPFCGIGTYGLQYECTEFVRRFYGTIYGANSKVPATGASPWAGNADQYFSTASQRNLVAFPNGGPTPPATDDIIVFESPNPADGGHVAIAEGPPTNSTLVIAEQNWGPEDGPATLTVSFDGAHYTVTRPNSKYTILGWLHNPGATIAASFISFIEGNPGIPGDGVFVNANSTGEFDLSSPISLASITNGLTFTIFVPSSAGVPISLDLIVVPTNGNLACGSSNGIGESPVTTTYNNVAGYAFNVTQADLDFVVSATNQANPSCNVSLASLQVTSMGVFIGSPSALTLAYSLDAVAVGVGQGVLP